MNESTKSKQDVYFFFGLFLVVTYIVLRVIAPYASLTLLAFIIATLARPFYFWVYHNLKRNKGLATFSTLAFLFFLVFIPLSLISAISINQVQYILEDVSSFSENNLVKYESFGDVLETINRNIEPLPGDIVITEEDITSRISSAAGPASEFIINQTISIGSSGIEIVANSILFLILLGTFINAQPKMIQYIKRLSPLDDKFDNILITRVLEMSESMVKGTFVIAIIQGILSGLILAVLGVPYAFFLGLLATFAAVIPLGSGLIQIPVAGVQLLLGNFWNALIILAWHIILTSNIDNFIRPRLVKKDVRLPDALILLGVFGGIQLFGFLGFIYGPVIMILFKSILDVYLEYYKE